MAINEPERVRFSPIEVLALILVVFALEASWEYLRDHLEIRWAPNSNQASSSMLRK